MFSASEWISFAALIVSGASAFYAYTAQNRAEKIRLQAKQREDEHEIFRTLMAERGRWGSPAMVAALNSVKPVFRGQTDVLDKWFAMNAAIGTPAGSSQHYFDLLAAMAVATDAGLRREDIELFFFSTVEHKETVLRTHHLDRALSEIATSQPQK